MHVKVCSLAKNCERKSKKKALKKKGNFKVQDKINLSMKKEMR
jgi:hypothetical protein